MTSTQVQEAANKDFAERAGKFNSALEQLKGQHQVNLSVNLSPASWASRLIAKLGLLNIRYDLVILDNKKIDVSSDKLEK